MTNTPMLDDEAGAMTDQPMKPVADFLEPWRKDDNPITPPSTKVDPGKLPEPVYTDISEDDGALEAVARGECLTCYGAKMVRDPRLPVEHLGFGGYPCPNCNRDEYGKYRGRMYNQAAT